MDKKLIYELFVKWLKTASDEQMYAIQDEINRFLLAT